jgi:hypothetical protein
MLLEGSLGQDLALVGCYAAYIGRCLPSFQDSVSIPSSSVKQSMEVKPIGCAEVSGNRYQHMLCNNPEEQRPHLNHGRSLTSHTFFRLCALFICQGNYSRCLSSSELRHALMLSKYTHIQALSTVCTPMCTC